MAVDAERNTWALHGDMQAVLERASSESIPPFRDDKANDSLAVRNAQASTSSFLCNLWLATFTIQKPRTHCQQVVCAHLGMICHGAWD